MYSVFMDAMKQWNKEHDRQAKLQHLYVIAAAFILVLSGLVSLLNFELGQRLLTLSLGLVVIFIINAITWALADSFIISRLTRRSTKR